MSAPVDVLAAFERHAAGLHSVANECARSDLSTTMRERAEEFDLARTAVADLIEAIRCHLVLLESFGRGDYLGVRAQRNLVNALARIGAAP